MNNFGNTTEMAGIYGGEIRQSGEEDMLYAHETLGQEGFMIRDGAKHSMNVVPASL